MPPLLATQVALALRPSLATISQRSTTDDLQQVTYQVSATALHELREYLLAWGERTKKPVGVSQLLETIARNISPEDLARVATDEEAQRVPLTCYLLGSVVEEIRQMGDAVIGRGAGVGNLGDMADRALRHFISALPYDKTP